MKFCIEIIFHLIILQVQQ